MVVLGWPSAHRTVVGGNTLPGVLPPWFLVKARWHDDRWQHKRLYKYWSIQ